MKTLFALCATYDDAKTATKDLLAAGAGADELNAVVQSRIAKDAMDVNFEKAGVAVTDEVGEQRLEGLDRLIAGEQAVNLPGVGDVFAAGELADFIAKAAISAGGQVLGLTTALKEFSVAPDAAVAYAEGVDGGGWLLFVRTKDDKGAQALLPVMRKHSEADVATVAG